MDFAPLDGTKSSWSLPKHERKESSAIGSKKKVKEKKGLMGFGKSRKPTVSVEESKSILFSFGRSDDYDADEDEPITSNVKSRLAWDMGNFLDEEPPTVDFKAGFAFVECSRFLLDDESDDPANTFQKSNFDFFKDIEEGDDESEHSAPELKSDESDVVVPDYSLIQCREEFEHSVSRDINANETLLDIVEGSLAKAPAEKKSKKSSKKKTKESKKTKTKKKKKKKKLKKEEDHSTTQNEKSSNPENFRSTNIDRQAEMSSLHENLNDLKDIEMDSQVDAMNRISSLVSRNTAGGDVSYVGMSSIASGTSSRQSLTHQDYTQQLLALNAAAGVTKNGGGIIQPSHSDKQHSRTDINQALQQRKYIDNMGDLMTNTILDGSIHTKNSAGREGDGYMADTDGAPDAPGQGHGHISPNRSMVKVPPTQNPISTEAIVPQQNVATDDNAPVPEKKRFRGLKKRLAKAVKS